jgi:hypothetical protein
MATAFRRFVTVCATLAPLALAGCGDGWVTQPYHGVPYDGKGIDSDDRTAGYGVEYVRASMMPSKGANTETIMEKKTEAPTPPPAPAAAPPPAPAPAPTAPAKTAEPIYNKAQEK